ncbi:MAG: hypothetical protein LBM65_05165 [Oscillospiraceae bacterium]|jgi:hypothetical protein|nr:hypothetical protein [Oscillospiraceae bacterium]
MICEMCGLTVALEPKYAALQKRSRKFLAKNQAAVPDITIELNQADIEENVQKNPHSNLQTIEYGMAGMNFFEQITPFDCFVLHASAVDVDGEGYLFCGTSGTGKSTHAALWLHAFAERAKYINDDKPIIKIAGEEVLCCGTPFSGKNDFNSPTISPVRAVYLLEQSPQNHIEPLSKREALALVLAQSHSAKSHEAVLKHLQLVEKAVTKIPFFRLKCNISTEAVAVAYHMKNPDELLKSGKIVGKS